MSNKWNDVTPECLPVGENVRVLIAFRDTLNVEEVYFRNGEFTDKENNGFLPGSIIGWQPLPIYTPTTSPSKNFRVFIVPATSSAFIKYNKDYYRSKKGDFHYMYFNDTPGDRTTGNTDYWNVYDINFVDENDKIIASTNKLLNLPGIPAAWINIVLVPNKGKITDVKLEMEAKYNTKTFRFTKYDLVFDDYGAVVVVSSEFDAEKLPNVNPESTVGFMDKRCVK